MKRSAGADSAVQKQESPIATSGKLSASAEDLFMQVFFLLDTPSGQEVKALAAKAGCEEEQVRTFFAKQRSSVRSFLQRAQRKAGSAVPGAADSKQHAGKAVKAAVAAVAPAGKGDGGGEEAAAGGPPSPLAALRRAGAGREAGLRKLGLLLDDKGALRDSSVTGQFNQLMGHAEAPTLRCAMLRALLATQRGGVRAKLLLHGGFLPTLEAWLREGEEDQQTTLLHLLLQVLEGMSLPPAAVRSSAALPRAVARLHKDSRHLKVVAAAGRLLERWQAVGGAEGPAAVAAGNGGSPAGAAAAEAQQAVTAAPTAAPAAGAGQQEGLRKPSAVELPHLMALGRKSFFGRSSTAPVPAHVSGGASGDGEAGTPRALGAPPSLRRQSEGEGTGAAAAASPRAGGGAGPLRSMPSAGPARTARPMSVDDIRKQKERQRASAALQSLGAGGVGAPAAKRLRPEGEAPRAPLQPPSFLAPHQQQHQRQQAQGPPAQQAQQGRPAPLPTAMGGMAVGGARPAPGGGQPAPGMPGTGAPAPAARQGMQWPPGFGAGSWGAGPRPSAGLPAELVVAAQLFERDRQQRAGARRVQLVQEYAALDEASRRVTAMRPALPAYQPPPAMQLPPLDFPAGRGEESSEAAQQRSRQAAVPPVAYPHPSAIPPSAAEPASHAPVNDAATPAVPFVSLDPEEQQAQNERLLQDGVRLPQYVNLG